MPDLHTTLHLDMLRAFKERGTLLARIVRTLKREVLSPPIYGLEWGDPEVVEPLRFVKDRYVLPYVRADHDALEIGPGGGRWTRYLLPFRRLTVVDYHAELLEELKRNFRRPNLAYVKNNGTDFPGVPDQSVDFLFSFGTLVHLDPPLIAGYLANMKRVLKPGANVVLQYSDKTKIMARVVGGFSENTPEQMREMVRANGYTIVEEDLTTMWHSSIVRFTP